eukprot:1196323-Prorocentrum_minimum.AAC.6
MGVKHEQQKPHEGAPQLIMLPHGAVLFKHWLCEGVQEKLVKEVHCLVRHHSLYIRYTVSP